MILKNVLPVVLDVVLHILTNFINHVKHFGTMCKFQAQNLLYVQNKSDFECVYLRILGSLIWCIPQNDAAPHETSAILPAIFLIMRAVLLVFVVVFIIDPPFLYYCSYNQNSH